MPKPSSEPKTELVPLGNKVNREVYEAWMKTVPRRKIGESLTRLMVEDLVKKSGQGQIVLHQSLTQYISAEDNAKVTVVNRVEVKLSPSELWAEACIAHWVPANLELMRSRSKLFLEKEPSLQSSHVFQELLKRLEASA